MLPQAEEGGKDSSEEGKPKTPTGDGMRGFYLRPSSQRALLPREGASQLNHLGTWKEDFRGGHMHRLVFGLLLTSSVGLRMSLSPHLWSGVIVCTAEGRYCGIK